MDTTPKIIEKRDGVVYDCYWTNTLSILILVYLVSHGHQLGITRCRSCNFLVYIGLNLMWQFLIIIKKNKDQANPQIWNKKDTSKKRFRTSVPSGDLCIIVCYWQNNNILSVVRNCSACPLKFCQYKWVWKFSLENNRRCRDWAVPLV